MNPLSRGTALSRSSPVADLKGRKPTSVSCRFATAFSASRVADNPVWPKIEEVAKAAVVRIDSTVLQLLLMDHWIRCLVGGKG
jgi:hypothetical protein